MSYDTGLSMEERVTSLFQPDTLLPDQYLETFRRKLHLEPEKKLMLAVLEDAIACYQKYIHVRDGKARILFQETEDWIKDENADWFFSFSNVCETLGFEPAYLRQGLLKWKEQRVGDPLQAKVVQLPPRGRDSERRGRSAARIRGRKRRAVGR